MGSTSVAEALDVSVGTVFQIKRRFVEEGLEGVRQRLKTTPLNRGRRRSGAFPK